MVKARGGVMNSERLTGAMVRVFEVRGTRFPDAPSNPGDRRSDQIQNRSDHKNFEGAVPLAQGREKHAQRPVGNGKNAPGNKTGDE